jgi:hypothetical protein
MGAGGMGRFGPAKAIVAQFKARAILLLRDLRARVVIAPAKKRR